MNNLKSMTAYARHEQQLEDWQLVWEMRSVNHRYLDAHFHLPVRLRVLEQNLKAALAEKFSRGRVDVNLSISEHSSADQALSVDQAAVQKWSRWQDEIHFHIPNAVPLSVHTLIKEGNILEERRLDASINEKDFIASFASALAMLQNNREAEGARLQSVLEEKLGAIELITHDLIKNMPEYSQAHQSNWQAKIDKFLTEALDAVRLHQEIAILIAKSDVAEELDRLESHISEFRAALASQKPVGRRLDFLLQEFNREANTLGSKSIHKDITNASVEMKVMIDQLREQVQNIE